MGPDNFDLAGKFLEVEIFQHEEQAHFEGIFGAHIKLSV